MTIHIYRTTDVDPDQFEALLEGANGPLRHLRILEGSHVSVQAVTDMVRSACDAHGELGREEMFTILDRIRKQSDLPEGAILVLLTRTRHDGNWFSIGETNNHYIHADDWKLFTDTSFELPVTFLLASNTIMRGMYDSMEELAYRMHKTARGCIMDQCAEKQDISLKMRTADACPECMARIKSRIRDGKLDANVVIDCFRMMDKVRRDLMYRRRWRLDPEPGRLTISGYNQNVSLPGMPVPLSPIRKALYLFFLLHPEGVRLVDLPDAHHVKTLARLYGRLANTGTPAAQEAKMRKLAENRDGRLNQHLSVIRNTFNGILGNGDALLYTIEGTPGERFGIQLPRKYVRWTDQQGNHVRCGHPGEM